MAVSYEDISKVNEMLSTVDIKGKQYVTVPQRIKAFRMLYPNGFIITDILSNEGGVVIMQAKAGVYDLENNPVTLGTGLAFERQDSSYINKTSYIENCETSAIGRALGFMGLGIDGAICSAEELINAITNQEKPEEKPQQAAKRPATMTAGTTVPPTSQPAQPAPQAQQTPPAPETPAAYIKRMIKQMSADFGPSFNFMSARQALIDGGQIPNKPSAQITDMKEAKQMIAAFYEAFGQAAS